MENSHRAEIYIGLQDQDPRDQSDKRDSCLEFITRIGNKIIDKYAVCYRENAIPIDEVRRAAFYIADALRGNRINIGEYQVSNGKYFKGFLEDISIEGIHGLDSRALSEFNFTLLNRMLRVNDPALYDLQQEASSPVWEEMFFDDDGLSPLTA